MDELTEIPITDAQAVVKLWFTTWLVISCGGGIILFVLDFPGFVDALMFAFAGFIFSIPALIILAITLYRIAEAKASYRAKMDLLYILLLLISFLYGLVPGILVQLGRGNWSGNYLLPVAIAFIIYAACIVAMVLNKKMLRTYLGYGLFQPQKWSNRSIFKSIFNISIMQNNPAGDTTGQPYPASPVSNKILIKSIITAALILVMLIPTTFIQSLITEREDRQKEVVEEVSSKWALPQTVSAPYLVIPYYDGKGGAKKQLIVLPEQLNVKGNITEEERPRSIYKVLLYKSKLNFSGSFHPALNPADSAILLYGEAKLCFGLTDFRGIEDKLNITLGNNAYTFLPGLSSSVIDSTGLSVPVIITADAFGKGMSFNMDISLRGSGSLHFLPLGSYSNFDIQSSWPGPSFDGNTLPNERKISDTGFLATWKFNAANLPFTSLIKDAQVNTKGLAFGVSLVQPADQYVKSMRSAKYAILIIGLTFVLFFIFELMQKKPVHPVQYLLVGMALVIFYTLLVSISEMVLFDYAYSISAIATIILISLYAKSHFNTGRSAIIFALLLSGLYGFIYVLISLEDTALLVGSIALFIVVAIIMYVTRKVNWYQPEASPALNIQP